MQLPSEIEAKYVLPTLRALVAKKLVLEKGYTQEKAAKAVGVTQAAISNYIRGVRGFRTYWENNPIVLRYVDRIVDLIVKQSDQKEINREFNQMLIELRRKGFLCNLHKNVEPFIDTSKCNVCFE